MDITLKELMERKAKAEKDIVAILMELMKDVDGVSDVTLALKKVDHRNGEGKVETVVTGLNLVLHLGGVRL